MEINKDRIKLRRVTKSDIEVVIDYRIIFLIECQGMPSLEIENRLRKSLREYLLKSLENNTFISWIADYENKAIGFSGMVIRKQPGTFEIPFGNTGYILNMFTIKEFRHNGIASLLVQKLIEEAKKIGLDKVELYATNDGEPVYRQLGFVEPHDKALEIILKTGI
jgi:GNAT superfamily N-acetyltransferase